MVSENGYYREVKIALAIWSDGALETLIKGKGFALEGGSNGVCQLGPGICKSEGTYKTALQNLTAVPTSRHLDPSCETGRIWSRGIISLWQIVAMRDDVGEPTTAFADVGRLLRLTAVKAGDKMVTYRAESEGRGKYAGGVEGIDYIFVTNAGARREIFLPRLTKEYTGKAASRRKMLTILEREGRCCHVYGAGDVLRSTKAATAKWRTWKNVNAMWTYSREITDPTSTSGVDKCRRDPTTAKRGAEAGRGRLVLSQILLRRRAWMNTIGTRRNERKAELSRLVFGGEVEKWKTVDIGRRHSYGADGLVKRVDGEALLPYERRRRSNRLRQPMLGAPSQCRHIHGADGFGGEIPVG
ncbi:hypothetical protein B0H16DRAFT_1478343 [Mycena metata]|uniref:Uncharacterized protein n=1 Tax=Mycena metata TaxID=1033252 RepID=A0AAD7H7H2_9AGAR|nr:hypothetical protein B0H16DRAFT_1478343 [Mycena metata]